MRVTYKMVQPILQKINLIYYYNKGKTKVIPESLTLDECVLLQKSDYSRFDVPTGILTPEQVMEFYKKELNENKI